MALIEDPDEARRKVEEMREQAPRLPEKLRFRGLRESLEYLYAKSLNEEEPGKRITGGLQFIAAIGERLDSVKDDADAAMYAEKFHRFARDYKRPKFRRSVGVSQDGVPVLVWESAGSEKTRHQVVLPYASTFDKILSNEALEQHYAVDILPWVSAAAELARQYGFLRPEGRQLPPISFAPEEEAPRRPRVPRRDEEDDESAIEEEIDGALDGLEEGDEDAGE